MCLVSSLSHSWGNFKFFSLSFLRYFGLIISFIWLIIYFIYFFLCSDIYPIPAIFLILWWEIGAISSFLVYQSYFTLTIIKAQEKIAQNTNNLSNLFHGQAQAEYYLVGRNIILMALYSIIHYSVPLNHDFTEPVISHTSSASLIWWTRWTIFPLYPLLKNVLNYTSQC